MFVKRPHTVFRNLGGNNFSDEPEFGHLDFNARDHGIYEDRDIRWQETDTLHMFPLIITQRSSGEV